MDSLTQIVLGAAVGEAVLGKKIGNKALLWGAVAGTIPDLDVFIGFFVDDFTGQELHRGFSHSIVFAILGALIFSWSHVKVFRKSKASRLEWRKFYFWTLVTHPLLDCHTNYGTQLFWPLPYRVAYNNVFVADPLYTLPFLLCILVVLFLKRKSAARRWTNYIGLGLSTSYMIFTIISKGIGVDRLKQHFDKIPGEIVQYQTSNSPLNAIVWNGIIETDSGYYFCNFGLRDKVDSIPFFGMKKNFVLRKQWEETPFYARFNRVSEGYFLIHEDSAGLYFSDLRFRPLTFAEGEHPFIYSYRFPKDSLSFPPKRVPRREMEKRMQKDWDYLMQRIKGERPEFKE